MFAYVKGAFAYKSPAVVHVDVNGLGYEVHISLNTYSKIADLQEGLLHTTLLIREDAHVLYGFFDLQEKAMFEMLISVSGVGASTARIMLSYMQPEDISRAIVYNDTKSLESVKGIGKKTAERLVVELKDKLAKQLNESNILPIKSNSLELDALNALTALGINRQMAEKAVKQVLKTDSQSSVEEVIKKALRTL